ncbi:hypothetical protein [Longimycelium tulufanense]|nr:hypothetical protein [Longimycelium tulufanense]
MRKRIAGAVVGLASAGLLAGSGLAGAQETPLAPEHPRVEAKISFVNPGEIGLPEPYGKIVAHMKDGGSVVIWEKNNRLSTPWTAYRTFYADPQNIEYIDFDVKEADLWPDYDDLLAEGSRLAYGLGGYAMTGPNGSVNVTLTSGS